MPLPWKLFEGQSRPGKPPRLLPFDPQTIIAEGWMDQNGRGFSIADAAGIAIIGATGSGKTSGPGRFLASTFLSSGFGGIVLCSKLDERRQWETWARLAGRTDDLVIFSAEGGEAFNFLDWQARSSEGANLTLEVVALLDEIVLAISRGTGSIDRGGDNRFWADALHLMLLNLIDLTLFAGLVVSLSLLRAIVNTAPLTLAQAQDATWLSSQTACARILREADAATGDADPEIRGDFEECLSYWTREYPALSERTRSIINLMFSMLVRPFITRPLRRLFSGATTVTPEDTFDGKIIIVDIPVQQYRLAGRVAALAWKHCFQTAVLRRAPPEQGYLRPVFLFADEAQNFLSGETDTAYQAVARSSGGCSVFLFQNRELLLSALGSAAVVDSLLGNLQTKVFCQNSSPETNEWASSLFGRRYVKVLATSSGQNERDHSFDGTSQDGGHNSGVQRSEQSRLFVEPSAFTTLKRGGAANNLEVEAIVYAGGKLFTSPQSGEPRPYQSVTFKQD